MTIRAFTRIAGTLKESVEDGASPQFFLSELYDRGDLLQLMKYEAMETMCEIIASHGNGTYDVRFEDGHVLNKVRHHFLNGVTEHGLAVSWTTLQASDDCVLLG